MRIFDTLSGEKKELKQPIGEDGKPRPIKMFVCGPTVYDYPHIGNARTFVFFDMFVRYLRSQGMQVKYLQNITDIDDKIIQRAKETGTTWQEVSKTYEEIYFENLKALGVDTAGMQFARATEHIPEIIAQVQRLQETGHVYKIEGDPDATAGAGGWYFDITKYAGYGELARRTVQQAEDGVTRLDNSEKKRNAGDFCLWKLKSVASSESRVASEPSWESELGTGRPGWHIEDTAITEHFFGPQYDIHGGALDLKFPHHEAERALQESASGKTPFVNFWMHTGFLTVNGTKMSKSLGNFMTVDDVLKKMTADEFRMMLLIHHYRQPLDYIPDYIDVVKKHLIEMRAVLSKIDLQIASNNTAKLSDFNLAAFEEKFHDAIADDFNTPLALGIIFQIINQLNKEIWSLNSEFIKKFKVFFVNAFASFGITLDAPKIPAEIQKLAQERELSRASKQFAKSDGLRVQIEQLGYVVEDTPAGPLVLPKTSE